MDSVIKEYLTDVKAFCDMLSNEDLKAVINALLETYKNGNKIFVAGNGGSAGTSNHFCCDFGKNAVKNEEKRPQIISLSANVEVLTALGNDFSYADVFSEQLKNLMSEGDLVLLISASGNSPNVVKAAEFAKSKNGTVVSLTGFKGGALKGLSDINVNIDSTSYEKIEDLHMIINHIIVCAFKSMNIN